MTAHHRDHQRRPTYRGFEPLEPRTLLSAYFVSSDAGNDANPGTADAPFRTIQRAADLVQAGDVVTVRAGTYAGFVIGWDGGQDGTADAPITFHGEAGANITDRNSKTPDGIDLEGTDYVVVEGFYIDNTLGGITRAGIRSVDNRGAVIRNNAADLCGQWGIFTGFAEDVTIENNVTSRAQAEHGIYVSNSADRPTIRGNVVWGNRANGIHMNGDASQGGDGIISGALVERNVIYGNGVGGGSGINADGVQDSVFRNNLLYGNHASGISLYRIDAADGAKNNLVVNNTIVMPADGRWAVNISGGSSGNVLFNNVLYHANTFRGSISITADSLAGFASDYNITDGKFSTDGGDTNMTLAAWRAATAADTHSTVASPAALFVAPDNSDFHLAAGSPAIDFGTPNLAGKDAPATDNAGGARPQGLAYDAGAFELGAAPAPGPGPGPAPVPDPTPAGPTHLGAFGLVNGKKTKLTFTDGDGTAITATLTGGGTADVSRDANGRILLEVSGTGPKSALTLKAGKGGDGRVALGDVHVAGALKGFKADRADLAGAVRVDGDGGALTFGSVAGGTVAAAGTIASLELKGGASGARFLAGVAMSGTATFAAGTPGSAIRKLKVGGSLAGSTFAAGVLPGDDGAYGTSDDVLAGGPTAALGPVAVKVAADASCRFAAGLFGKVKIGKATIDPATDPRFVRMS